MSKQKDQFLDQDRLERTSDMLKTLAHPTRIKIVEMLQSKEKMAVGEIQKALKIQQAAVSNHLRLMKDHQIVASKRDGKKKYYYLNEKTLSSIIKGIEACGD